MRKLPFLLIFCCCFAQQCTYRHKDYSVEWRYDGQANQIIFSIKANVSDEEFLTGVAFGKKEKRMDFLGVFVRGGKIGIMDGYVTPDGVIHSEEFENLKSLNLDYDNGLVIAEVERPLTASDEFDLDLSGCIDFHFPSRSSVIDPSRKTRKRLGSTVARKVCDVVNNCGLIAVDPPKWQPQSTSNCSFAGDDFTVAWRYDEQKDLVTFDIKQKIMKGKRYTAIGIGESMDDLDIAIILLDDGIFRSLGDFGSQKTGPPVKDAVQDFIAENKQSAANGSSHIQFSRKLDSNDRKDRTLDGCVTLQFAINAGSYTSDIKLEKHKIRPVSYEVCDIKSKCIGQFGRDFISDSEQSSENSRKDEENNKYIDVKETTLLTSPEGKETEGDTSAESSVEVEATTILALELSSIPAPECPPSHQDLGICNAYFDDYFGRVAVWAKNHNEAFEDQYWKACTLLSKAAHVPTLCCTIFNSKCAEYLRN